MNIDATIGAVLEQHKSMIGPQQKKLDELMAQDELSSVELMEANALMKEISQRTGLDLAIIKEYYGLSEKAIRDMGN